MHSPPLAGIDIGSPRQPGSTRQSGHRVEILAAGEDIWGTRDEFHFAHVSVAGDFSLSARLVSLTMADLYTKAGLMIRSSKEDASDHAYLLSFGDNRPRNNNNGGIEFSFRSKVGGSSTAVYPPQPLREPPDFPASLPDSWLRLTRSGGSILSEYSRNGKSWTTFSIHRQLFAPTAYVGLAATSHNANHSVKSVFSNLHLEIRN